MLKLSSKSGLWTVVDETNWTCILKRRILPTESMLSDWIGTSVLYVHTQSYQEHFCTHLFCSINGTALNTFKSSHICFVERIQLNISSFQEENIRLKCEKYGFNGKLCAEEIESYVNSESKKNAVQHKTRWCLINATVYETNLMICEYRLSSMWGVHSPALG